MSSDEEIEQSTSNPNGSHDRTKNAKGTGLEYDPDQKVEDKRKIRAQYRQLLSIQDGHRTDIANITVKQLLRNQEKADQYFKDVKAPQEATLDSKVMLQNAEMGAAMARAMKHDTEAFDVDEFIATLVTFMGGRSDAAPEDDEGEIIDDSRPLEWEKIGQRAYMHSRKASCMDFMVGPLSIEVKQRKKATRSRLERDKRNEVRPQELKADELQRSENETTKMVRQVAERLTKAGDKGVNLFEFIINPKSFAQSVENLFYVSFLVRDGLAAVFPDEENGNILTVYPSDEPTEEDRVQGVNKQQVFILTPKTWKEAIEVFQIQKPLHIPNRERPEEYNDEIKDERFLP